MRLNRLANIVKQTSVFYPLVAAAIIVPNLVLGVYGYWALATQQTAGEEQLRSSYRAVLVHLNRQTVLAVQRVEETLPAKFPVGTTAAAAVKDLWALTQRTPMVLDCFVVGNDGKPPSMAPLPEHPLVIGAPGPVTPLTPLTPPLPDAAVDAIAQRRQRFLSEIWPRLSRELGGMEIPSHMPIWDERTRQLDTFYVSRLILGDEPGYLVAWLDLNHVRDKILLPQISTLTLESGLSIEVAQVDPTTTPAQHENVLVRERADRRIAPHWMLNLKVANLDQFRQSAKLGVTLYVALAAMCLPFVVLGSFVMIRSLMKDIREARQKTDFVSRVTHELKTPLTSIRLFIETLQMGGANSPEDQQKCLDIILQESERLSKLIERVLDLSKIEAGNKVYHFRDDDFEAVVRDTIEFFRKQASEVGGVIRLYIERNLPRFSFDRDGVREVLLNLLENALKYSFNEKIVWIRVTRTRHHDSDAVQVQVIDNGMGIRKEEQSRIFEKFYRCDDTLNRGIDGSGLGLTVSREIARVHGGDIFVESDYGRGSKFTLVMPMKTGTGPRAIPATATRGVSTNARL